MAQIPAANLKTFLAKHPELLAKYEALPQQVRSKIRAQFRNKGANNAMSTLRAAGQQSDGGTDSGAIPVTGGNRFQKWLTAHPDIKARYDKLTPEVQQQFLETFRTQGHKAAMGRLEKFFNKHPELDPKKTGTDQGGGGETGKTDSEPIPDATDKQFEKLFPSITGFNDQYYQHARQEGMADLEKLMAARGLTDSGAEIQANQELISDIGAQQAKEEFDQASRDADRYYEWLVSNRDYKLKLSQEQFDRLMEISKLALAQDPSSQAGLALQDFLNNSTNLIIEGGKQIGEAHPDVPEKEEEPPYQPEPGEGGTIAQDEADAENAAETGDEIADTAENAAGSVAGTSGTPTATTTGMTGNTQQTQIPRAGQYNINQRIQNRPRLQNTMANLGVRQQNRVQRVAQNRGSAAGIKLMRRMSGRIPRTQGARSY